MNLFSKKWKKLKNKIDNPLITKRNNKIVIMFQIDGFSKNEFDVKKGLDNNVIINAKKTKITINGNKQNGEITKVVKEWYRTVKLDESLYLVNNRNITWSYKHGYLIITIKKFL